MAGGWGSAKNGVKIGAFWDGIEYNSDKSQARITDARVAIDRSVNITDTTNRLEWSGGAVTDGSATNLNLSGSGDERIKNVSAQWQTLEYGKTKTATFASSLFNVEYAGSTLTVSKTVTYPARPYAKPGAATNVVATRVSDTSQKVTWTNSHTSSAPWTTTYIERWVNTDPTWKVLTTLTGSNALATTYTDSTTAMDRKYQYRVRGYNTAGYGPYGNSGYLFTTPLAPTALVASKTATGDVLLNWANSSTVDDAYEVSRNESGGAFTVLGVFTGADKISHTDVGPPTAVLAYKVRLRAGTLFSGYSNTSNTIQVIGPPNAPTNLANGDDSAYDGASAIPFTWQHNPVDSSPQTWYRLRYRTSEDGSTWTDFIEMPTVESPISEALAPAGTFTNGLFVEWGVQTWGLHTDASPYSASRLLRTSEAPTVNITNPVDLVQASSATVRWEFTDPEGTAQAGSEAELWQGGIRVAHASLGALQEWQIPVRLEDDTAYEARVRGQDGAGMWSPWDVQGFQVTYPAPAKPILTATWDRDRGSLAIGVLNPGGPAEGDEQTGEVARNECPSPQANNLWVSNYGTGGMGTDAEVSDPRFASGYARKMTWTVAGGADAWTMTPGPTVAAGETWTYSVRTGASAGVTGSIYPYVPEVPNTRDAEGQIDHGDGTVTHWLTCTFSGSGSGYVVLGRFGGGAGDTLLVGDGLITKTPVRLEFFMPAITASGAGRVWPAVSTNPDVYPAWTGAENNSPSVANVVLVEYNEVYRSENGWDWEFVTVLPPNGVVVDPIPAVGIPIYYKAIAFSGLPSSRESDVLEVAPDSEVITWAWFNSGPGFSVVARCRLSPGLSEAFDRTRVVHRFDGRDYGTPYAGEARTHTFSYKGTIETDKVWSTEQAFRDVVEADDPAIYRDAWYRWYVAYDEGVQITRDSKPILRGVTVGFQRIDYDEELAQSEALETFMAGR